MLIIGGTGDLSRRHLLPALTRLLANDELPRAFSITLTGLEPVSLEAGRDLVAGELAERVSHLQADVRDADSLRGITAPEPLLIYVATPPAAVPAALEAVRRAGLHRSARIVLDKPFGLGRESAQALNAQVLGLFAERDVHRVDHFLYHRVVQELVGWRVQSDPLSLVDLLPVEEVAIVWDETRDAEPSGDPFSDLVRDMIQSHLLQLVAVITMDPPGSLTGPDLARCRLDALRSIASATEAGPQEARGAAPETLATLTLSSRMPRWKGVRFSLRAAKGVDESRRHVEFRPVQRPDRPASAFVRLEVLTGKLVIAAAGAGAPLEFAVAQDAESASTRLLRAALAGDDTFTLAAEEPEEAWRIVEPVLQAREEKGRDDA